MLDADFLRVHNPIIVRVNLLESENENWKHENPNDSEILEDLKNEKIIKVETEEEIENRINESLKYISKEQLILATKRPKKLNNALILNQINS